MAELAKHDFGTEQYAQEWIKAELFKIAKLVARRISDSGKQVKLGRGVDSYEYKLTVDDAPYLLSLVGPTCLITDDEGAIRGQRFAWSDPHLVSICLADGFLSGKKRETVLGPEPKGLWQQELEKNVE